VRPGRAADHSPPSSAAVMEEYSYTSTHPLGHTGPVMGSLIKITLFDDNLRYPTVRYMPKQLPLSESPPKAVRIMSVCVCVFLP